MNGVYNAIFIVILMLYLVCFDYIYSIGDQIINQLHVYLISYPLSNTQFNNYQNVRSFSYTLIINILAPFLVFLSFTSSFINRNQDIGTYLISSLMVIIITPVCIYIFAEIITNMLSVSFLDVNYMATNMFNNFLPILVANMLLTLASFVFLNKGVSLT